MKKSKRFIASLLALQMAVGLLLSGCGAAPSNSSSGANKVAMNEEGLPIVDEKVTFHMVAPIDPAQAPFEEMAFFKELEERTNVHIEWELIPSADFAQKKNLILAGKDYPDAFFMGIDENDIERYAPQGVFLELDDLIAQYCPRLTKIFEDYPIYKSVCTATNGKVYGLANANAGSHFYNVDQMFINKAWLDKLGLPIPETTDDLYNTLKAFKTQDPNGNGLNDEIPFSFIFNHQINSIHSLFGSFGRPDFTRANDVCSHFVVEDGKVVFTADKPEFKAAVEFYHKFFEEGLFDAEGFTQDAKQYRAKGVTEDETLGSFMAFTALEIVGPDRVDDYVPLGPLKGPDGDQSWISFERINGGVRGPTFAITKNCENPEILMRWIDEFYDVKTSIEANFGPVRETADGKYETTEPEGMTLDEYRFKECPMWAPSAVFEDYYGKYIEPTAPDKLKADIREEYYQDYQVPSMPFITWTQEEATWNAATGTDIMNYVNDNLAKWLLNGGIEEEWDDYVAQLNAMGLEQHIQVMQTAYDRQMSVS